MELMLVCRARWAMVAWMCAVDDELERYDADRYAHLCAERDTLIDALMAGEYDATCLTEPYASLAEKEGCRMVTSSYLHGTEVASDKVDTETYAKFNRAVKEAVKRINADRSAYMHYFLDYYKGKDPRIEAMSVNDLRESRVVVVDPAPIPEEEALRTAEWIKSWGMLAETQDATDLINMDVQTGAHAAAE